ncbi:MAG: ABC transporter permease subunit, partial [Anaerolineales bacterium]
MWPFIARWLEVSTIFLLAGIGELIDERSGVLNVGIEGLMLFGASFGFLAARHTGNLLIGFIAGMAAGCALGFLHGFFSITLKVDQIVSAMGIWIFAMGFVTFWTDRYSGPLGLSSPRIGDFLSPLSLLA